MTLDFATKLFKEKLSPWLPDLGLQSTLIQRHAATSLEASLAMCNPTHSPQAEITEQKVFQFLESQNASICLPTPPSLLKMREEGENTFRIPCNALALCATWLLVDDDKCLFVVGAV